MTNAGTMNNKPEVESCGTCTTSDNPETQQAWLLLVEMVMHGNGPPLRVQAGTGPDSSLWKHSGVRREQLRTGKPQNCCSHLCFSSLPRAKWESQVCQDWRDHEVHL